MDIETFRTRVTEILNVQKVTGAERKDYAAHYTRATTPSILLESPASNSMRQYDGDYMNDPEEGRYLVDVMIRAAKASNHPFSSAFVERLTKLRSARLLYSAFGRCTFLSCWTTTRVQPGKEDSSDSLNHWRFYGDDGKGACLIVPLENLLRVFPEHLYRVNYGIDTRGGGSQAVDRPVRQVESALVARFNALKRTFNTAMVELEEVVKAVHPLLFIFKSSEYSAENEVRSIVHKDEYSQTCGVLFDDRSPARAYVRSSEGVVSNGSFIYFGPKSDHAYAIEAMGRAANLGVEARVFVSSMPYR